MKIKYVLSAGFGALALGLVATTAQAGPIAGLGGAVDAKMAESGLVEKANWYGGRDYDYGWRHRHRHFGFGFHKPRRFGFGYYDRYRGRFGFHDNYRGRFGRGGYFRRGY